LGLEYYIEDKNELYISEYLNFNVDYILINKKCLMNGLGGHYAWFSDKEFDERITTFTSEFNYSVKAEKGTFILLEKRQKPANLGE